MKDRVFLHRAHGTLWVGKRLYVCRSNYVPISFGNTKLSQVVGSWESEIGWAIFGETYLVGMTTDEWITAEFECLGEL